MIAMLAATTTALFLILTLATSAWSAAVNVTRRLSIPSSGTGDGTYYNGFGAFGACGIVITDNLPVVAFPHAIYDSTAVDGNPNHNKICGQCIRLSGPAGWTYAWVQDRCEACLPGDIDMTPAVYQKVVGNVAVGRQKGVTWTTCSDPYTGSFGPSGSNGGVASSSSVARATTSSSTSIAPVRQPPSASSTPARQSTTPMVRSTTIARTTTTSPVVHVVPPPPPNVPTGGQCPTSCDAPSTGHYQCVGASNPAAFCQCANGVWHQLKCQNNTRCQQAGIAIICR